VRGGQAADVTEKCPLGIVEEPVQVEGHLNLVQLAGNFR